MNEIAVQVQNAYKSFGHDRLEWRWPWQKQANDPASANGHGGNGSGPSPEESKVTVAVDHLTFDIYRGEIFGVLGPNGSGKSTLIRLIATLLIPDQGEITVFGHDVVADPMAAQRLINRVSVEAAFFKKLSPMENLLYGARLYGVNAAQIRSQVTAILQRLDIPKKNINRPMDEMSRGMQQKVAIARALLSSPKLLLLDEPTTGLDPRSKREVQTFVRELRDQNQTTILLTTHDMVEAENLCDRIAIMEGGRLVALDTPANLKTMVAKRNGRTTAAEPTLEDVFLELTGKQLITEEDMPV
jgi:ABC-2 type transport system ATP-binding protein